MSDVAFDPRPRPAPGSLRAGRPRYVVTTADLRLAEGTCPACGGPKPLLIPEIPPGMEGTSHREVPSYEQISGYTRFIRPYADNVPCAWCETAQAVGRLMPRAEAPAIESPEAAELRQLRESLLPASAPEPWTQVEGGRFPLGATFCTPSAAIRLDALRGRGLLAQGVDAPSAAASGREQAKQLLEDHAAGDFGLVGALADGDAELGAQQGPLATGLDSNATAVASGRGLIRSAFRIEKRDAKGSLIDRELLHVRTALAPDRPTITLVHLGPEINS